MSCLSSIYGQLCSYNLLRQSARIAGAYSPAYVSSKLAITLRQRKWKPQAKKVGENEGRKFFILGPEERTVACAINYLLKQIFEPALPDTVVGWRKHYGSQALAKWWPKDKIVYEYDIKSFFRSVRTALLMARLSEYIHDRTFLQLIKQFLLFYTESSDRRAQGLPVGVSFSPILGNFYLLPIDRKLVALRYDYRRYSDNWYFTDMDGEQILDSELATIGLEIGRKRIWKAPPTWLMKVGEG